MADSKPKTEIEVGQWVRLPLGGEPLEAQVIEDRGNLGIDGERVLRLSVPMGEGVEPMETEVPESHLLPAV
jgi:hypothetical protein